MAATYEASHTKKVETLTLSLFQIFERETRREKILEARHREIKLKQRAKSAQDKV